MYLGNIKNPVEFQGHRSKVKVIYSLVDESSLNCFYRTWKKIVVYNAVLRLSISRSVPEIFPTKVYSCPKSSALSVDN